MKKTVKRKIYNYSKADWRALNFDVRRTALKRLCDKHIPKITIGNEFQARAYLGIS